MEISQLLASLFEIWMGRQWEVLPLSQFACGFFQCYLYVITSWVTVCKNLIPVWSPRLGSSQPDPLKLPGLPNVPDTLSSLGIKLPRLSSVWKMICIFHVFSCVCISEMQINNPSQRPLGHGSVILSADQRKIVSHGYQPAFIDVLEYNYPVGGFCCLYFSILYGFLLWLSSCFTAEIADTIPCQQQPMQVDLPHHIWWRAGWGWSHQDECWCRERMQCSGDYPSLNQGETPLHTWANL